NYHGSGPGPLCFTPDGRRLAGGGQLWDVLTGRVGASFADETCLAVSPDGKVVVTVGGREGPVRLWDLATRTQLRTLQPQGGRAYDASVASAAFSPAGKLLATGSTSRHIARREQPPGDTVHLWEAATGKRLRGLAPQRMPPSALLFSPDGETLAVAGEAVRLWAVPTGQELYKFAEEVPWR